MRKFCLALSGPVGTGKSTLAKALAQAMSVPYLEEDFTEMVRAISAIRPAGSEGHVETGQAAKRYLRVCESWLDKRVQAMSNSPSGFVADRWALDVLVRWLYAGLLSEEETLYMKLVTHVQEVSRLLDAVIIPPLLMLDKAPAITADRVHGLGDQNGLQRNPLWTRRLHAQALTRGLLEELAECPRLYLPVKTMGVDERVDMVFAVLHKHQSTRGFGDIGTSTE